MQKTKRHILCTRLLPEALLAEAAAQNICIDVLSFIETKPVTNIATQTRIHELFQKPIAAVFTSSNAVRAVAQLFQKPISWNVYCLANETAKTVTQLFQLPISGTAPDASTLADVIIKNGEKKVFFFCGNLRREVLPQKLHAANISAEEIVVYETIETPNVVTKNYDAVLFYSPSAVQSFFSVNTLHNAVPLFAIGATTAEAIQKQVSNPVVVSKSADSKRLIQQVIHYFNKQNASFQ